MSLRHLRQQLLNGVSPNALSRAQAATAFAALDPKEQADALQKPQPTTPETSTHLPALVSNASVSLPTIVNENRTIDYATWTAMAASVRLSTGEFDENRAIDCVAALIPML